MADVPIEFWFDFVAARRDPWAISQGFPTVTQFGLVRMAGGRALCKDDAERVDVGAAIGLSFSPRACSGAINSGVPMAVSMT
jgi:hypothetical protein